MAPRRCSISPGDFADIRHRSTAVIEHAKVPFQFLARRFVQLPIRLGVRIRSVLRNLILRANAVRQFALFSSKSVKSAQNLRPLLGEVLERRAERLQQFRTSHRRPAWL